MPLDEALRRARDQFGQLNPLALVARSGVTYHAGQFVVPFFHRLIRVAHPSATMQEEGERTPPDWLQLIVLHYLLTADGTPTADDWISFRQLPGGLMYEPAFAGRAIQPLATTLGQNLEGFRRAAASLGGQALNRYGDGAFRFLAFPYLPVAALIWLGDEELPPSADILFDRAASHYLPTEDLSAVGGYLSRALIGASKV